MGVAVAFLIAKAALLIYRRRAKALDWMAR
jgi:sulfate transport system permease protein